MIKSDWSQSDHIKRLTLYIDKFTWFLPSPSTVPLFLTPAKRSRRKRVDILMLMIIIGFGALSAHPRDGRLLMAVQWRHRGLMVVRDRRLALTSRWWSRTLLYVWWWVEGVAALLKEFFLRRWSATRDAPRHRRSPWQRDALTIVASVTYLQFRSQMET